MGMKKLDDLVDALRTKGVLHYQGPAWFGEKGLDGPPVIVTLDPSFKQQVEESEVVETTLTPAQEAELRRKSPDGLLDAERKEQYFSSNP